MSKKSIVDIAKEIAAPVAEKLNLYFWEVQYKKEGANWYLRYFMDSEEGLTMDACEEFSREVGALLDEKDPIKDSYYLEVSSPGIDRELNEDWHFEKMIGSNVEIKFYKKIDNAQNLVGELLEKTKDYVKIKKEEDKEETYDLKDISWVRLYVEF